MYLFILEHDWSEVLIGNVPDRPALNGLEILKAEWVRVEPEPKRADDTDYSVAKKRLGDRFDWNSLSVKRRKRGGLPKDMTVDI